MVLNFWILGLNYGILTARPVIIRLFVTPKAMAWWNDSIELSLKYFWLFFRTLVTANGLSWLPTRKKRSIGPLTLAPYRPHMN